MDFGFRAAFMDEASAMRKRVLGEGERRYYCQTPTTTITSSHFSLFSSVSFLYYRYFISFPLYSLPFLTADLFTVASLPFHPFSPTDLLTDCSLISLTHSLTLPTR